MKKHVDVKNLMKIAASAGLFLCAALLFLSRDNPHVFVQSIRAPVGLTALVLNDGDIPAKISNHEANGRILGIRGAVSEEVGAGVVAAMQLLETAAELGSRKTSAGASARSVPGRLAPLLGPDYHISPLFAEIPYASLDALDLDGVPVRWRIPANRLFSYSVPRPRPEPEPEPVKERPVIKYTQAQYRELVENFASRYNLNTALVMAIIHSESNFSPALVSNKSAMGLMQLLPSTASGEVHRFLYGKSGRIGFDDLRIPETNIRYGTAYLHILLTRYFSGVADREVRELCVIASYNLGPNRFLKLYGPTPAQAVENINAMSPAAFMADLKERLPTRETRYYVEKVRRMKDHYAGAN